MFPTQVLPYQALDPPIEGFETIFCRGPVLKIQSCSQKMVIFHDPLRSPKRLVYNPPYSAMDFHRLKKRPHKQKTGLSKAIASGP